MDYNFNQTEQFPERKHRKSIGENATIFGVLVIVAGMLLLARNTGLLNQAASRIIFSWEMLLIAIGVSKIILRRTFWSGVIVVAIGGFFLLVNFYHMPFNTWQIFFPALIILVGLQMIFKPMNWKKHMQERHMFRQTEGNEDFFEDVAIFGGSERRIVTPNLKGGRVVAAFGGSKVDLTHCNFEAGTKPMIEVVSIFGGTTMLVPSDWNVKVEVFNIFGGFMDKRIASQVNYDKTISIKGVTIFGGGEVKSF